jgi:hypothetical protein
MLIGITGKIGSGKSTVADYLVQNYNFTEYALANPIKKIGEIFGFDKEQLYGTQEQKLEIHPYWNTNARTFMQKIGTDLFRDKLNEVFPGFCKSSSIWIDIFKMHYTKHKGNIVISDIRFEDEAEAIKSLGGILIRVEREYKNNDECISHKSEKEMSNIKVDYPINNQAGKNELYEKLDELIKKL